MAPRPAGPAWLYRLFDAEGALVYIGVTRHPRSRMHQHRYERYWFVDVSSTSWTHFADGAAAYAAEVHAIRTEAPRRNVLFRVTA